MRIGHNYKEGTTVLTIYRGPTRAFMDMHPLHEYGPVVRDFTKNKLGEYDFDPKSNRFVFQRSYSHYDDKRQQLNIPVNFIDQLADHLAQYRIPFKVEDWAPIQPRKITTMMKPGWTDRPQQVPAIEYLTQSPEHRKGLQLDCGLGKTYTSIKSWIERGDVGMVVVSGLVDQWVKELLEKTTVGSKIWIIQGYDSITRLLDSKHQPDIIVASLETVRAYANGQGNYQDLPPYNEFLRMYGVGTKIYDEVHRNFHALTLMDLKCDVNTNIYLTATFTTANKGLKKIFECVYPHDMRFGADSINKHVDVIFYNHIGQVQESKCVKARGYMHAKYEAELIKRPTKFKDYMDRIILPELNSHYINVRNKDQKAIIFFSTLQMIADVKKYLVPKYPKEKIMSYTAADPESNLVDADIILSTFKSAGTGTDIKNLRTVINTVSVESETQVLQLLGRLRKLPNGDVPIYVDNVDEGLSSHQRHARSRKWHLKGKARTFQEHNIR